MKKIIVILLASLLILTACGKTTTPPDKGSEKLIMYSNSTSDGRGDWLIEKAAAEGFELEVVDIPGGDLPNRLIAEKNNRIADLIYGLNSIEFEKLKKQDMLVKYKPNWAGEVDSKLGDGEFYYPIVTQPLVFVYNNELTGDKVPKDMLDLIKPEFVDQYTVFGLGGGTAKTILSSLLVRYADPKGDLGISEEGWTVIEKYVKGGHVDVDGDDYVGNIISGDRPISMLWGSGVLKNQKERDYKFEVMQPEIGVPFVVEQAAILNKDKIDTATAFINWFGSSEVQAEMSEKFGTIPAHPVALEGASDDVKEFMSKVKPQNIDWGLIADNVDKWVEKIELEYTK